MKYISDLREGSRMAGVYLCKHRQSATTKNGKPYDNVVLQDKTGTVDAKIWEPNSGGIDEFDDLDYIDVVGEVISFAGALQVNIRRVRRADEGSYDPSDYLPVSKYDIEEMYRELQALIASVKNPYLKKLLEKYFVEHAKFIQVFKFSSAAKSVHHGFVGGLLEHTLSVARMCEYYSKNYPVLNRDLLLTAAIFHDIGKTRELSAFPTNDYTDDGQLLGHIMLGTEMVHDAIRTIPDFPKRLASELQHCILAHHGELEYGSPKKPALAEALALNMADNTDAKLQTMTELLESAGEQSDWLGFNRIFESNIRKTSV